MSATESIETGRVEHPPSAVRRYELHPIPPERADQLRALGGEVYVSDEVPGYPCRQCLRDAEIGEEVVLVAYDPFECDSPYRSTSAIFVHREPCASEARWRDLPLQLTRRVLSVRAFDEREMMVDAAVIDGRDLDATIRRFAEQAAVDHVHIHNAERGCWAATAQIVDDVSGPECGPTGDAGTRP